MTIAVLILTAPVLLALLLLLPDALRDLEADKYWNARERLSRARRAERERLEREACLRADPEYAAFLARIAAEAAADDAVARRESALYRPATPGKENP